MSPPGVGHFISNGLPERSVSTSVRPASPAGSVYRYRAARPDGSIDRGTVRAPNAQTAGALIAARGDWLLDVRVEQSFWRQHRRLSLAELGLGLRLLASLIEAGLPIGRALATLDDVAPDSWRASLPEIRQAVQHGAPLAEALAAATFVLPPVVIGIIRAGEAGSGLSRGVRRAATLMESAAATRTVIRAALAYPLILCVAGAAAVALLVGVVLPKFASILSDLGQALPPTTQAVLSTALFLRRAALPGAIAIAGMAFVWRTWSASPGGRPQWHAWLLRTPILGTVRRSSATARYAHALSALLESGVPIGVALRSAADAAGDAAVGARLLRARDRILHGESVAAALAAEDASTQTTIRLVRAGEESGQLAELLAHAAMVEQERAERAVKSAIQLLEPALILAFGGLVAVVAAALLQAVYSVRPGV
jgi:general secretion pathway protein F